VQIDAAAGLPAIWADHDRLEQVFVNLIGNVFRHNGPDVRATVTAELVNEDEVRVRVADDGSGMASELASSLFDPGRRQRSTTAGTGLGLLIAKAIVDAHGGRIALAAVGRGTAFDVHLPIEQREVRGPEVSA
jgi:signal transduction histidine kinase